jgi:hypothetical protein
MGTRQAQETPSHDFAALRRKITQLIAQNALPMVQQAIDSVREDGQFQAMKYLFEMVGLYPASAEDQTSPQDSLASTLLAELGLAGSPEGREEPARKHKNRIP